MTASEVLHGRKNRDVRFLVLNIVEVCVKEEFGDQLEMIGIQVENYLKDPTKLFSFGKTLFEYF